MGDRVYVAVVGPGDADPEAEDHATAVGRALARAGAVVVCGLGRVMDAALSRARRAQSP